MSKLNVLVTGATGQQGGALAHRLLDKGHKVRAFTRKPESPAALKLKNRGAQIVTGSFTDQKSLEHALSGVEALFAMSTFWEAGIDGETHQGQALANAAKVMQVKHFVFTSVASADQQTGIPHFDSKYKIEQYLKELNLPYTIIAPVYFMENALAPWQLPAMQQGQVAWPLPPTRKLQQIALADIANFAVLVLENRDRFLGRRFDISSDDLTGSQVAEIISRVSGHPLEYYRVPMEQVRAMSADFAIMYEWFERVGYSVDFAKLRKDYPEVGWHTFEGWARQQDWSVLEPQAVAATA